MKNADRMPPRGAKPALQNDTNKRKRGRAKARPYKRKSPEQVGAQVSTAMSLPEGLPACQDKLC